MLGPTWAQRVGRWMPGGFEGGQCYVSLPNNVMVQSGTEWAETLLRVLKRCIFCYYSW